MLKVGVSMQRPNGIEDLTAVELLCGASNLPRGSVLSRWRGQLPAQAVSVLCAPRSFMDPGSDDVRNGPFFPLAVALDVWKRMDAARDRLGATAVLLRTGPRFRPTDKNREFLVAFGLAVAQPDVRIVWSPSGLWDSQDLQEVAAAASMHVATDPVADGAFDPVSDWQYFRVRGLGRARLGRGDLELLAEMIQDSNDGICILATGDERNDGRLARRLLSMVGDHEFEPS